MSRESEIPPKSTAIIDSSVLFAMGGPDNEKYSAFEEFVTGRGLTVRMPEQVAEELGEGPERCIPDDLACPSSAEKASGDETKETPASSRSVHPVPSGRSVAGGSPV